MLAALNICTACDVDSLWSSVSEDPRHEIRVRDFYLEQEPYHGREMI